MKNFDFKLEKVLNVREIEEDLAQNELIKARHESRKIEKNLNHLNEIQNETYQFLRKDNNNPAKSLQARRYLNINRTKINKAKRKLKKQDEIVEEKREKVVEKTQNRKMLETLKEKAANKFYRESLKKEQKELDELAIQMSESSI
ncbi:flagellar export protein FliJ [Halanaerobiaceae bacterium Z-7014]|uniref:Flagellar FliJ protein n=1 Tax=Halonatronomonas betaini TaxID=2778430 RepID=A0A931F5A7_9FIRM|nr:flagellar export protein FliJ [Halonatronomonas betaini]MBF8435685.1 flagellar export protein FliJ [Halonatronomonas betaini]